MKTKFVYRCQECGYTSAKWLGKCPDCSAWNSFVEEKEESSSIQPAGRRLAFTSSVCTLDKVGTELQYRYKTKIEEFDRILGSGIVPGSVILIGGAPGIGKSTLLLQTGANLTNEGVVLYVSGEESLEQIKNRALRLKIIPEGIKNIYFLSETNLENILQAIDKLKPNFLFIDSIQTMYRADFPSAPGTVTQVRECTAELVNLAKMEKISVFLSGHITKGGVIAGPRVLEHLVDTVLYFETESQSTYRILRVYKNRFGPTNEIGIFEMKSDGLQPIANPGNIFLQERLQSSPGIAIVPVLEGTRPLFLEVQALVTRATFAVSRRTVQGYDYNRLLVLLAVLEKKLNWRFDHQDVFVNIVGGLKVKETAVDFGIILALASAWLNYPFPLDTVVMGEIGLTGEVRSITQVDIRLREAERLGFRSALIPEYNLKHLTEKYKLELKGFLQVDEAINFLIPKKGE